MKRILFIFSIVICLVSASNAALPNLKAEFAQDSIAIGEHFTLSVEIEKDVMQAVFFPDFENDKLTEQIEILSQSDIDTLANDGRTVTLKKDYKLTTFDAGDYTLDSFPVLLVDKNSVDTLKSSRPLKIAVTTIEIDTTTMKIHDIIPPLDMPVKFGEWSGYFFGGLLILALLTAMIIWLVKRFTLSKRTDEIKREKAHVVAIKRLEALHHQKLWQNSKHKQYYTSLTDILRQYLEHRYGVKAMEMTTIEIMEAIKNFDMPTISRDNLKLLLTRADFVKFAKFTPEDNDNETSYNWAYYFVEETKLTEIETDTNHDN